MNPRTSLLTADSLSRTYSAGGTTVRAVDDVSLAIEAGQFVALAGPSGCGKSTLLHLCGAMDRPTSGRVRLEGVALDTLDDDALTRVRRDRIGFVFQFFNLLPTLTLVENVALPRLLAGGRPAETEASARALIDRVGLGHRERHYPPQLSGGEQQRAAIARALVNTPALVIADEPTGNLDSENGRSVLDLLTTLNQEQGVTLLLATHAADVAASAHRLLHMRDGRLVDASGAQT
jgi:putative ABC transport system ATP-binding protein